MPAVDAPAPLQFTPKFRDEIVQRFGLTEAFVQQAFGASARKLSGKPIDQWEDLVDPAQQMSSAYVHFALSNVVRGRQARDLIVRETGITQGRSLDVGSAYGGMVAAFSEAGFAAQGVEIDAAWCALGNLNCRSKGFGNLIRLGDFLSESGFGQHDVVTCNDVIEHVMAPRQALEKMAAMLNPGGALYLVIPNGRSWDHVIRDGHFGQFAMNLLDHHAAVAYYDLACKSMFSRPYSCGEFYDLDWYLDVLEGCDLFPRVRRAAPAQLPDRAEFAAILAKLDQANAEWKPRKPLPEILVDNIRNAFARYRRAIERDYAAAGADASLREHFVDTDLTAFWTVIARRAGGNFVAPAKRAAADGQGASQGSQVRRMLGGVKRRLLG
jgi:2-polyprenyl-3-methyl-5-hydroxy-6-metoxy-1,4-benzoquinol methylase